MGKERNVENGKNGEKMGKKEMGKKEMGKMKQDKRNGKERRYITGKKKRRLGTAGSKLRNNTRREWRACVRQKKGG